MRQFASSCGTVCVSVRGQEERQGGQEGKKLLKVAKERGIKERGRLKL